MKEIEVKARIKSIESLKEKLVSRGCVFSDPVFQDDQIFLANGIEFPDIQKETAVVRVRQSGSVCLLTLKKRLLDKDELVKLEEEVIVSDRDGAVAILQHMGYYEVVCVNKKRVECPYEDLTICLDEVAGLGSFIEVEKLTEDDDITKTQKRLLEFLRSLGIDESDRIFQGYDTLMHALTHKE
jgi:adenylate cyclase class 2